MNPAAFIALWRNNPLSERAGAQAHFDDLCDMLGVDKPSDPDNYCFERGAKKAGFPRRPVAKPGHEKDLKQRTLTNLYNARPAWLDNAHKTLDAAVAAAYGWNDYTPAMPDEEILKRLLSLNLERSAKEGQ